MSGRTEITLKVVKMFYFTQSSHTKRTDSNGSSKRRGGAVLSHRSARSKPHQLAL